MYLRITGKSKKISRKQVREAAFFFAGKLMSSRLIKTLEVYITFKDNLWRKEKLIGACEPQDIVTPREFKILIDPNESYKKILEVLAHEFVHIKQYAKGELRDYVYHPDMSKYRGEYYDAPDTDDDAYWDSPWEIEAYGREQGLRVRFMKHIKKKKR